MKKLFDVRFNVFIIGLTISSILERGVTTLLNSNLLNLDTGSPEYHILSLAVLIVFFLLTNVLLRSITEKTFISKIAFGKRFIGGIWVEFVIKKNKEISHITKMGIQCDVYEIKVHGESFRSDETQYTFDSICSILDEYKLHYIFIADEAFKPPRTDRGYLNFKAASERGRFNKYIGHYTDGDEEYEVVAIRIKDKSMVEKLSNDNDFVKIACAEIFPDIKRVHSRHDLVLPDYFRSVSETS